MMEKIPKGFKPTSILIAGLVLFLIGFAQADFKLSGLSTAKPYDEKVYTDDNVTQITVQDDNVPVEFAAYDENYVSVRYFENKEYQYRIENKNGRLSFEKLDYNKWYDHLFSFEWDVQDIKLVVYVPKSFQGAVAIKTSNGDIDFDGVHTAETTLSTSNGKVTVRDADIQGNLEVKTSNGKVRVDSVNVQANGNAKIRTSNSGVECTGLQTSTIEVKTSNGTVSMKDTTAALDVVVSTDSGRIVLDRVAAAQNVVADTSNSSIELSGAEVGKSISCTTSNGKITGTIVGRIEDFSITSHTSNGENNLPKKTDNGAKTANFRTSNSDIDIQFRQ